MKNVYKEVRVLHEKAKRVNLSKIISFRIVLITQKKYVMCCRINGNASTIGPLYRVT